MQTKVALGPSFVVVAKCDVAIRPTVHLGNRRNRSCQSNHVSKSAKGGRISVNTNKDTWKVKTWRAHYLKVAS